MDSVICPYCGVELIKIPVKKTKCKSCGEYYYCIIKPGTNTRFVINHSLQKEWRRENRFVKKIGDLKWLGITESEISKSIEINDNYSLAFLSLLKILFHKSSKFISKQGHVCLMIAKELYLVGRNPKIFLELYAECLLCELETSIVVTNPIILLHNNEKCKNCNHLDGVFNELHIAKKLRLLPHHTCEDRYCMASYSGIVSKDNNGFAIRKTNIEINKALINKELLINKIIIEFDKITDFDHKKVYSGFL